MIYSNSYQFASYAKEAGIPNSKFIPHTRNHYSLRYEKHDRKGGWGEVKLTPEEFEGLKDPEKSFQVLRSGNPRYPIGYELQEIAFVPKAGGGPKQVIFPK